MHELGICDAMLKMVRGIAKENELNSIQKITVEVGSLSGVVPSFLSDCWVAVTDGTELEGVFALIRRAVPPEDHPFLTRAEFEEFNKAYDEARARYMNMLAEAEKTEA